MNFDTIALLATGVAVIGYVASLEIRLRSVQNQLLKSKEVEIDEKIRTNVSAMPDDALDAALKRDLSGPADTGS